MADFKKSGVKRFYENHGKKFDRQDAKRPAFAQKKWDGPSRPATMYKATCAQCGNPCEVPFRPYDNRLVYCNACFQGKKGAQDDKSYNKFPQKNYGRDRSFDKPGFADAAGNGNSNILRNQLEALNIKIDRLARAVEAIANTKLLSSEVKTKEPAESNPLAKTKKESKKHFKKNKSPF